MESKRPLKNKKLLLLSLLAGMTGMISGCASNSLYYWGNYETVLYSKFNENSSPLKDIELLLEDKKNASTRGKMLPPGFHSHLGMLYYDVGNSSMAKNEFLLEKNNFSESKVLMNRFLNVKGTNK